MPLGIISCFGNANIKKLKKKKRKKKKQQQQTNKKIIWKISYLNYTLILDVYSL